MRRQASSSATVDRSAPGPQSGERPGADGAVRRARTSLPGATRTRKARSAVRQARMRTANSLLSVALIALLMAHGVGNAAQLVGVGSPTGKALAHALVAVASAHAAIGVLLTVQTLRAQRSAGVAYVALNRRFWAARASGLAIAVAVIAHVLVFYRPSAASAVRLAPFDAPQLVASILLVASIAVHVIANVHPLMIGLGIPSPHARAADVIVALSVALLLMAVAFVVYYLRWAVV